MPIIDKKLATRIDSVTLKSLDTSVKNWFERDKPITIEGRNIPVIYATAERWARAQKEKGFRDDTGVLILPLISIRRTSPDVFVERYVPESEDTNITLYKTISTTPISQNDRQPAILNNRVVDPDYLKTADETVYETIQIPFPAFLQLDYDITVWTSMMTHQNLEQENIFKEWRGGRQWFSQDNYYFFGLLRGSNDQSNLDDFSDKEKIIKYQFKLALQAYLVDRTKIKSFRSSTNAKVNMTETSYIP